MPNSNLRRALLATATAIAICLCAEEALATPAATGVMSYSSGTLTSATTGYVTSNTTADSPAGSALVVFSFSPSTTTSVTDANGDTFTKYSAASGGTSASNGYLSVWFCPSLSADLPAGSAIYAYLSSTYYGAITAVDITGFSSTPTIGDAGTFYVAGTATTAVGPITTPSVLSSSNEVLLAFVAPAAAGGATNDTFTGSSPFASHLAGAATPNGNRADAPFVNYEVVSSTSQQSFSGALNNSKIFNADVFGVYGSSSTPSHHGLLLMGAGQ